MKVIFENEKGQFPCFLYNDEEPMKAIVPGVKLPKDLEQTMIEIINSCHTDEYFKEIGFNKSDLENYINSKSKNELKTAKI